MDCRTFDKHQLGFVDGTLPDALVVEMQLHLSECERCARRDTAFRRGLMILRNLPQIQPSPDFGERLSARLKSAEPERVATWRPGGFGAVAAAAACVMAAGYFAIAMTGFGAPDYEPMLAPIVASQPEPPVTQAFDHVLVMPASVGLAMWPSALMVEHAPVQMELANLVWGDR